MSLANNKTLQLLEKNKSTFYANNSNNNNNNNNNKPQKQPQPQ
jgi:hypothetical protein